MELMWQLLNKILNFSKSEVKNPKSTLILLVLDIDAVGLILSVF